MRFSLLLAISAVALPIFSGCGAADVAQSTAVGSSEGAPPSDPIALVAYEFLDAVRRGDTSTASSRLTPLALQKTNELDLDFSPPGSPTASFQIGEVEIVAADKAVVDSTWSDRDADGKVNSEQIIWALRMSEGKWRISGMAAELSGDRPSVVIDFENPETLVQQPQAPPAPSGENAPPIAKAAEPAGTLQADRSTQDPFQQPVQR